jgi:hypothetical protein
MFAILHTDFSSRRTGLKLKTCFFVISQASLCAGAPPLFRPRDIDRALFILMTKLWPTLLGAAPVVQSETILRWHRAGFKMFWRWKSRNRAGRPKIDRSLRDLIRRMSQDPWTLKRSPQSICGLFRPGSLISCSVVQAEFSDRHLDRHRGHRIWRRLYGGHRVPGDRRRMAHPCARSRSRPSRSSLCVPPRYLPPCDL